MVRSHSSGSRVSIGPVGPAIPALLEHVETAEVGKRVPNANAGYAMSKFAVVALTHAARQLVWKHGVRVTAVCPGYVATDMTADVTSIAHQEMIQPGDLAQLVATVIALPNNAAVAELVVNCRLEAAL